MIKDDSHPLTWTIEQTPLWLQNSMPFAFRVKAARMMTHKECIQIVLRGYDIFGPMMRNTSFMLASMIGTAGQWDDNGAWRMEGTDIFAFRKEVDLATFVLFFSGFEV